MATSNLIIVDKRQFLIYFEASSILAGFSPEESVSHLHGLETILHADFSDIIDSITNENVEAAMAHIISVEQQKAEHDEKNPD